MVHTQTVVERAHSFDLLLQLDCAFDCAQHGEEGKRKGGGRAVGGCVIIYVAFA